MKRISRPPIRRRPPADATGRGEWQPPSAAGPGQPVRSASDDREADWTERHLRLAVKGAGFGVWVADLESGFFDACARARELHHCTPDDPLDTDAAKKPVHPDDLPGLEAALTAAFVRGEPFVYEYRTSDPSGGIRWISSQARFFDEDGRRRLYGIVRDITKEKQAGALLVEARDQLEYRVSLRTAELEKANAALREKSARLEMALESFRVELESRRQLDRSLRDSEVKYRQLYESIMDAVAMVDLSGRITETNRAFQEMLGYSAEELAGLSYLAITPAKWHAMEKRLAMSPEFFERGYSKLYEKEYLRKDGRSVPVELRAFLIHDASGAPKSIWAVVRDITLRKQAEHVLLDWNRTLEKRVAERTAELNRSEARFRHLADATFEGIAITENDVLVDANHQLAELHRDDLASMIGRPVMDFVAPESRALVAAQLRKTGEATIEFVGLRKDGTSFPAEARTCIRHWQGRESRVTAIRDLSETKEFQARFHRQQKELEKTRRLALISEVSAGIVHQVGQPLCAMGANLMVAIRQAEACAIHPENCGNLQILRDVLEDVGRLREAVVHLRSLANPESCRRLPVQFNEVVSEVASLLHAESRMRSIQLNVSLDDGLPMLTADQVQLSQVVHNLLHNSFEACDARPPDQRRVDVFTRLVEGRMIELRVLDSGTGIAPEIGESLFHPFRSSKPEGLGMGLALCLRILEAHGACITGENRTDAEGAVFTVRLPLSL